MPVKDRLVELQTKAGLTRDSVKSIEKHSVRASSKCKTTNSQNETFIPLLKKPDRGKEKLYKFYEKGKDIKEILWKCQEKVTQLRSLHDESLSSFTCDPESNSKNEKQIRSITANLNDANKQIKEICTLANEEHKARKLNETEYKLICNFNTSLINEMVMEDMNHTRTSYEEQCKKRIRRQLEIAGYPIDEKETEEALLSGTPIFLREFAECEAAKQALRDLMDRQDELHQIEKALTEIRDLFQEFSLLVSTQGETIDTIERNVLNGQISVKNGNIQLEEARKKQSSSRKMKLICLVVLVVVVVIIIAVVAFQFI